MDYNGARMACQTARIAGFGRRMRREGGRMAQKPRPTVRRIELGYELRQLRERAEMTMEEVVEQAAKKGVKGLYFAKLQRVETGLSDLRSASDLRTLLDLYGVTDERDIEQLLAIQREAASQDWWTPYRSTMPSGMPRFVGIEAAARETWAFHPSLILGLLQTEAYARTLYQLAQPIEETTSEFIDRNVKLRMRRQDALTRSEDPLVLRAVLWEPALRYLIGDVDVMVEQYEEIIKLAALPNVTVQVLPLLPPKIRGYLPSHDFSVLHLNGDLPASVQVDNAWSATSVSDKPREVGRFTRKFNAITASALPPEDTPAFLEKLKREITK
ncbi:helix-turn-helix domain-containing protein [Streptomyces echinoruber]|uniref:Transcriptional regulator n=1 Tax=Streptomyces echinoruber TaxID=68898 RepID=A0A918V9Q9_9ACTN|nr:helix-turn-helix transcriptional regulator [Streptomyces echinoruber]GGZ81996.1 transcriptional regulator [Streptomyces echinoruber]